VREILGHRSECRTQVGSNLDDCGVIESVGPHEGKRFREVGCCGRVTAGKPLRVVDELQRDGLDLL
jgi:hypothetical protein